MWADHALPLLRDRGLGADVATRTFRLTGIGESQVAEILGRGHPPRPRTRSSPPTPGPRRSTSGSAPRGEAGRRPADGARRGRCGGRPGTPRRLRLGDGRDDLGRGHRGAAWRARLAARGARDRHRRPGRRLARRCRLGGATWSPVDRTTAARPAGDDDGWPARARPGGVARALRRRCRARGAGPRAGRRTRPSRSPWSARPASIDRPAGRSSAAATAGRGPPWPPRPCCSRRSATRVAAGSLPGSAVRGGHQAVEVGDDDALALEPQQAVVRELARAACSRSAGCTRPSPPGRPG